MCVAVRGEFLAFRGKRCVAIWRAAFLTFRGDFQGWDGTNRAGYVKVVVNEESFSE